MQLDHFPKRGRYVVIDLSGKRFGRLKVIQRLTKNHVSKGGHSMPVWSCKCDCGKFLMVTGARLRSGMTKSCGCYRREKTAQVMRKYHTRHGGAYTPEYSVWRGLLKRCSLRSDKNWKRYGGRGIKVCSRWLDFANFIEDMGKRPNKGMLIDREDNDGNYEPQNCRWVTPKMSSRNRWNARFLTLNGVTKCVSEWAEELEIRSETIRSRINLGWTDVKILTFPVRKLRC